MPQLPKTRTFRHSMTTPVFLTVMSALWHGAKEKFDINTTLACSILNMPMQMQAMGLHDIEKAVGEAYVCYDGGLETVRLFSTVIVDSSSDPPSCLMSVSMNAFDFLEHLRAMVLCTNRDPSGLSFESPLSAALFFWSQWYRTAVGSRWTGTPQAFVKMLTGDACDGKNAAKVFAEIETAITEVNRTLNRSAWLSALFPGGGPTMSFMIVGEAAKHPFAAIAAASAKPAESRVEKAEPAPSQAPAPIPAAAPAPAPAPKPASAARAATLTENLSRYAYINCRSDRLMRIIRIIAAAPESPSGERLISTADIKAAGYDDDEKPGVRFAMINQLAMKTVSWSKSAPLAVKLETKLFKSVTSTPSGLIVAVSDAVKPFFAGKSAGVTPQLIRRTIGMAASKGQGSPKNLAAIDLALFLLVRAGQTSEVFQTTVSWSEVVSFTAAIDPCIDIDVQTNFLLPDLIGEINEKGLSYPFTVEAECRSRTLSDVTVRFTCTPKPAIEEEEEPPVEDSPTPAPAPQASITAPQKETPSVPVKPVQRPVQQSTKATKPAAVPAARKPAPVKNVQPAEVEPRLIQPVLAAETKPAPKTLLSDPQLEMPARQPSVPAREKPSFEERTKEKQSEPASEAGNPIFQWIRDGATVRYGVLGFELPLASLIDRVSAAAVVRALVERNADLGHPQAFWDAVEAEEAKIRREESER